MKSLLDTDFLFQTVPMWMCPTCGRVVTLPMGTSTSMPDRGPCQCAGHFDERSGTIYGHYTMLVPNKAAREFDERWEQYRRDKHQAEKEREIAKAAASQVHAEQWGRIYLELTDVDGWTKLALPFLA